METNYSLSDIAAVSRDAKSINVSGVAGTISHVYATALKHDPS